MLLQTGPRVHDNVNLKAGGTASKDRKRQRPFGPFRVGWPARDRPVKGEGERTD